MLWLCQGTGREESTQFPFCASFSEPQHISRGGLELV